MAAHRSSSLLFVALMKRFQYFYAIAKRDCFEYLKRSLSFARIMASDDTCPLLAILVWSQPADHTLSWPKSAASHQRTFSR
jgi:hypothetical protein